MSEREPVKVLFVCMGNICRSPTAEGAFRKLVEEQGLSSAIHIDSAGTHAYHVGEAPDLRAQSAASNRQIDISMLRGRKFSADDFREFDYVLAMDRDNFSDMQALKPADAKAELVLMLDYASKFSEREVPDPYYGGKNGFEFVLDLLQDASAGLLQHIRRLHSL